VSLIVTICQWCPCIRDYLPRVHASRIRYLGNSAAQPRCGRLPAAREGNDGARLDRSSDAGAHTRGISRTGSRLLPRRSARPRPAPCLRRLHLLPITPRNPEGYLGDTTAPHHPRTSKLPCGLTATPRNHPTPGPPTRSHPASGGNPRGNPACGPSDPEVAWLDGSMVHQAGGFAQTARCLGGAML
jgi:hypothetical protein